MASVANKKPRTIGGDTGELIGKAFSSDELLAAGSVIKAAIPTAGADREALSRVLARLTVAYKWKATNG